MVSSYEKKKQHIAEESEKTRRAREKLKKKLDATDKKITQQGLEKKTDEIHRWIARHAHHRIILKSKISLFDENEHAAEVSQRISHFVEHLTMNQSG